MIAKIDWLKPEEKPYFHQISLDCNGNNGLEARSRLKVNNRQKAEDKSERQEAPASCFRKKAAGVN